jgi:hypothetical protein
MDWEIGVVAARVAMGVRRRFVGAMVVAGVMTSVVHAEIVTVTIENLAPQNGNFLTPLWVGFQNGGFDIYDSGSPASAGLERLAEDGNTGPLAGEFGMSGAGMVEGTILGPGGVIAPGESASFSFDLDGSLASSRFFSYASMVIPSNDAFIANGDPMAYRVFSDAGEFLGADFFITGADVLDAGTEVNSESPIETAFFGQAAPNTGITENGVVAPHLGFLPFGSGGILDDPQFANADFTSQGYPIAQIRVTPEPSTVAFMMLAGVFSLSRRRR